MKIRGRRFNLNLWVALVLALPLLAGCQSAAKRRQNQETVLRVHMETRADSPERSQHVLVGREAQVKILIEKMPFLTEQQVESAVVTNTIGGFVLSIKFNRNGSWVLENYSASSYGKRFAIYCQFKLDPESTTNYSRWLAAPKISTRIDDGTLVFTPDATREESENIAFGLSNIGRKMKDRITW